MSQEHPKKFIGRAIVIDPATQQDSDYSAYVCVLLTGAELRPAITVGSAQDLDDLLAKLRADDLYGRFKEAKLTFDPPPDDYPVNQSGARQRYEALSLHELGRAQTILSGR